MRQPKAIKSKNVLSGVIERIHEGEMLCTHLSKLGLSYLWGGARSCGKFMCKPVKGKAWTDCSGCAQYVLEKIGIKLKDYVGSTFSLAEEGHPGWSDYLTLCIKNTPGDEHIIIRWRKRPKPWHFGRPRFRYFECGGSDNPSAGDGPSWFIPGLKMGLGWKKRVREFYIIRNFDDQLGVN